MAAADRFVDRLPTDRSYSATSAIAYDAFMPPGTRFPDDSVHRDVIRRCDGTALELACGNGRFLIPARGDGMDVQGIDSSADMLHICRHHATERGLHVVLHEGDIAPLALDLVYGAIVCPVSSFTLIDDVDRAIDALRSYRRHLEPGGELALTMFTAGEDDTTGFVWRLRRTGTDDHTGVTYVVHEATGRGTAPQTILTYNRLEIFDDNDVLVGTEFRKLRMRWWHQQEMREALTATGFDDIRFVGDEHGWVVRARNP